MHYFLNRQTNLNTKKPVQEIMRPKNKLDTVKIAYSLTLKNSSNRLFYGEYNSLL